MIVAGLFWITFTCFVTTAKFSFFASQKDAAGAALKKVASALGSGQEKNRLWLRLHPKSGGSGSLTLLFRKYYRLCCKKGSLINFQSGHVLTGFYLYLCVEFD